MSLPTSPVALANIIREIVPFNVVAFGGNMQATRVEVTGYLGHVLTLHPAGTDGWTYTLGEKAGPVKTAADLGQALADLAILPDGVAT